MDRKFSRNKDHREHMMRNLVTSLVLYERVTTTEPKAKEAKTMIDRLINAGKANDLTARRRLSAFFFDQNAAIKIIEELAPRYEDRNCGYTRIFHLPPRLGDSAPQAILELIPAPEKPKKTEKAEKTEKTVSSKSEKPTKEDKPASSTSEKPKKVKSSTKS